MVTTPIAGNKVCHIFTNILLTAFLMDGNAKEKRFI